MMGQTFSVSLKKVKSSPTGGNQKGFRWVRARRFKMKKSIPRVKNTKSLKYTVRSAYSTSIVQ